MRNPILSLAVPALLAVPGLGACGGGSSQTSETMTSQVDPDADQPHAATEAPAAGGLAYPTARRGDTVDTYHGVQVADPYRWLEDPDSAETKAWVEAENKVTFGFLGAIPERDAIRDRLTALWNYEKYGTPCKRGRRYFFSKNDGLQNQNVLYWTRLARRQGRAPRPARPEHPVGQTAPSRWPASRSATTRTLHRLRPRSRPAATGHEWQVRDVATGKDLSERPHGSSSPARPGPTTARASSTAATPSRKKGEALPDTNLDQKLYYHRLGAAAGRRRAGLRAPRPAEVGLQRPVVSEDGRYLVISVWQGHRAAKTAALPGPHPEQAGPPKARGGQGGDDHAHRRVRRRVQLRRQRGPRVLVRDRSRRAAQPPHRDRHPQAGQGELGRADPAGRRRAADRLDGRRSLLRRVPEGRAHAGRGARPDGQAPRRRRAARPRHRRRVRRQDAPTPRRSTPSRASPRRRRSTATTSRAARARVLRAPKVDFDPERTTRRSRSSTRARTAPRCRCSSPTRRASRSTAATRPCSTATAGSTSR